MELGFDSAAFACILEAHMKRENFERKFCSHNNACAHRSTPLLSRLSWSNIFYKNWIISIPFEIAKLENAENFKMFVIQKKHIEKNSASIVFILKYTEFLQKD